ncbi:MAG: alpha-ketoglutaric semialdehyde dehydrogenase [Thermoleophilaceae bacterium]|nr:alpha-ketoglutaric semialdehyde dehydrogenase [Thermoleophilaceae bacterium]
MTATQSDGQAARYPNLVGGAWREGGNGEWLEVRNPADRREVVGLVPAMVPADVDDAYRAAADASVAWGASSGIARGRVLLETSRLLRDRRAEIARDLTREMGKTLAEAQGEVDKSADFFEYYAGYGRFPQGEVLAHERAGARVWTVHEPVGVVLAITPWNDPLLTPARKVAPALAAGNAVLLKGASYTPIVSHHLAKALFDAGLPKGVLATVTGSTSVIGDALVEHEALKAVSFTGSNEVGDHLRQQLAGRSVKLLAELGGKNAAVVLADADLDAAVAAISGAGFAQAGQRCTATSRLIVDRKVAAELLDRLAAAASALVVGPGLDPGTVVGPLVADEQQRVVAEYVAGVPGAVKVLAGGEIPPDPALSHGSYYAPTLLGSVSADMAVWREEIFGPVIAAMEIEGLDEAIDVVNGSVYGLAAGVYTSSLDAADRFAREVNVGQVAINLPTSGWDVHMPFGGFKASGSGHKEQGAEALDFYTRVKTVASLGGR